MTQHNTTYTNNHYYCTANNACRFEKCSPFHPACPRSTHTHPPQGWSADDYEVGGKGKGEAKAVLDEVSDNADKFHQ